MVNLIAKAMENELKHNNSLSVQTVYETWIDFDETYKKLREKGYCPTRCSSGRKLQEDSGLLTFCLKSGAKVNVSPKGQPHRVQITWNVDGFVYDSEKGKKKFEEGLIKTSKKQQYNELVSVLVPHEGRKLRILPLRTIRVSSVPEKKSELLREFDSEFMKEGLI